MKVRVLFFGMLQDAFGARELSLELPPGPATVGTLLNHLAENHLPGEAGAAARSLWPSLAVARNRRYAQTADLLQPGDEIALLPPVSGGLGEPEPGSESVQLTASPLDPERAIAALKAGADGAVVIFDGIVRNHTRGRKTQYLVYEAYEAMALRQMQALVSESLTRFPVRGALLHHRLGRLEIGETSVLIAVASAHRGPAFEACRWLIDTLKQTVPIWKKEFFVDGAVWADGEAFPAPLLPGAAAEHR